MTKTPAVKVFQNSLDRLTKKWWLYILLLAPIFIRPYASRPYDPLQTMDVIMQALSKPFIYAFPALFPFAKAVPLLLIIGVIVLGNRMKCVFNIYVGLLFLVIAIFQNSGRTETYGFVVSTGNLIMVLIVALLWIWEIYAGQNDFTPRKQPPWRLWVLVLAAFAWLAPVDSWLSPDFSLGTLLTSEAGLTNCMMLPVILSVLILYYPTVNLVVLRVMSFIGIYFGIVNVVVWFLVFPSGWWMGVLHIPLFVISIYAFLLSHKSLK